MLSSYIIQVSFCYNRHNYLKNTIALGSFGCLLFIFVGHGSRVRDTSGDEDDGYDECLCPVDCHSAGMIIDDQLYDILVRNLAQGVHMVALVRTLNMNFGLQAAGDGRVCISISCVAILFEN